MTTGKVDAEIKKLVMWRIETSVPEHFKLVIGDKGTLTKQEVKEHIQKEDDIGLKIIEMEMKFLKAVSSGEFSRVLAEAEYE